MGRDVPYDPDNICDVCKKPGAFDFMGDYICPACIEKAELAETDDGDEALGGLPLT